MLRSLIKIAFGSLVIGAYACAQITAEPTSTVVSAASESNKSADESESRGLGVIEVEPGQPPAASIVADPVTLLPDPAPVPSVKATLVGGTVEKLDRVRDEITVSLFGGGREKILFDPRTRIYKGNLEGLSTDLHEGQRIYLDTILDGSTIFARSIRLRTTSNLAEGRGVVLRYRSDRGELVMRDAISPDSVRIRTDASTKLTQGGRVVQWSSLTPGCLIAVEFSSNGKNHDMAREISILAQPGVDYTFTGQVVHLDLRTGLLVLNSLTDRKMYEIYLSPSSVPSEDLQIGALVSVTAQLENSRYVARNVTMQGK